MNPFDEIAVEEVKISFILALSAPFSLNNILGCSLEGSWKS
jgi:hypothetical protein